VQHRPAGLANAEALMIERTHNCEQINTIIASVPERARRAVGPRLLISPKDWKAEGEWEAVRLVCAMASGIGGKADICHSGWDVAV
jgi:hypothetical protein